MIHHLIEIGEEAAALKWGVLTQPSLFGQGASSLPR